MTTKQAIKVLSDHQKWRMGDDNFQPTIPSKLSEALDIAINIMSRQRIFRMIIKKSPESNLFISIYP